MRPYLDLIARILDEGERQDDRTGVGTLSVFGHQMRFDLRDGFPLVTTKKLHLRSIIIELLWFLRGDTNIAWLRKNKVGIWDEWATYRTLAHRYLTSLESERSDDQFRFSLSDTLPIRAKRERLSELLWFTRGRHDFKSFRTEKWDDDNLDLGPVYGKQWRDWEAPNGLHIDQIADLIRQIREQPASRRQIVSAWNPADLPRMALAPCHCLFQTHVSNGRLSLQLYQRSADVFLGVPFNIASYALLTHILAQQCDLEVGSFIWTGGDCHLYSNHLDQARLQLEREPRALPRLTIRRRPDDIDRYEYEDFEIAGYDPHPHIKAAVAV